MPNFSSPMFRQVTPFFPTYGAGNDSTYNPVMTAFSNNTPKYMQTNPGYKDVMGQLTPLNSMGPGTGGDLFQKGIDTLTPDTSVITPGTQQILDLISKAQAKNKAENVAAARSLAAQRGQVGSSTEQFGVQRAAEESDLAAINAQTDVYLQNLQRQQAARDLMAQGYFGRAGTAYQGSLINQQLGANLTSEEVASQRNAQYAQDMIELQKLLGERGLAAAQENIAAERDIARQQAKNQILSSLIGVGGNIGGMYMMNKMMRPGMLTPLNTAGLFGSGATLGNAASTGTAVVHIGGVPTMVGTGTPVASVAPMFGSGGTLFNTAGTSAMGMGNVLPGVAGWQLGTGSFGDNRYTNIGGITGGVVGSMFGPLGSMAGGFLGSAAGSIVKHAAENTISKVTNSVKSVFPMVTPKHKIIYN